MRAERRHELKENDLIHALVQVRDYFTQRGRGLGWAIIAAVVLVVVVAWVINARAHAREQAWIQKQSLSFVDAESGLRALDTLAELRTTSPDPTFRMSCLIDEGTAALALARQDAAQPDPALLGRARSAFELLLTEFPRQAFARGIAHAGRASVAMDEFVLDGNPAHRETARRHLEAIRDDPQLNGLPVKEDALRRLNELDRIFVPVTFAPAPPLDGPPAPEAALDEEPVEEGDETGTSQDVPDDPATEPEPPLEEPQTQPPAEPQADPPATEPADPPAP
jgi:hypothetical protein